MINLLPPAYRQTLRSRHQQRLVRAWLVVLWLSTAALALILVGSWVYINKQSNDLKQSIASTNQELAAQNITKVQKDAKTLTNNIKTINQVLSREIRFSDLIQDIGKVMPSGTVLNSLTLGQATGALDLSASAKNYATAAQIAVNLSDPANMIFNKVDINSISCSSASTAYPCTGSFRALFSKTAQSRYLGVAQGSQQ